MGETLTRCKCNKCGEVSEAAAVNSIHLPIATKDRPECSGKWKASEKKERQPHRGVVQAATCMMKNKETDVKQPAIGLVIEDSEMKQMILISKSNAMDLAKYLKKIVGKMI